MDTSCFIICVGCGASFPKRPIVIVSVVVVEEEEEEEEGVVVGSSGIPLNCRYILLVI